MGVAKLTAFGSV